MERIFGYAVCIFRSGRRTPDGPCSSKTEELLRGLLGGVAPNDDQFCMQGETSSLLAFTLSSCEGMLLSLHQYPRFFKTNSSHSDPTTQKVSARRRTPRMVPAQSKCITRYAGWLLRPQSWVPAPLFAWNSTIRT